MTIDRRHFLTGAVSTALVTTAAAGTADSAPSRPKRPNRIAVPTYSFWQFKRKELRDIEKCIDVAAGMGFDGVEILYCRMEDESNAYLQKLKPDHESYEDGGMTRKHNNSCIIRFNLDGSDEVIYRWKRFLDGKPPRWVRGK